MKDFKEKIFQVSKKVYADKAAFPEETIRNVESKLKTAGFKIYKGLKRIDKGRLGIPVYISLYDIDGQKITGHYKQMGKGQTEDLAKASALMELVERFSLFFYLKNLSQKAVFTPWEKLEDKTIPWELILHSVEDEEDEKTKEIATQYLRKVPMYFVEAFEVGSEKIKYLPFHWFWLIYEYNGSAAGNTYPEASVQAICELIERHTNALSVRINKPMQAIKRSSIKGDPEELLRCYERLGIQTWIRNMSFGFPVPTVAVMAMDPSTYPTRSEIVYAAGTATSPERALIRALTEVAQLAGDFDTEGKYIESGLPKFKTLEEAVNVINYSEEIDLTELPNVSSEDHNEELKTLTCELKKKGFEIYIIDITHSDLQIPAIYAIIPGVLFRERTRISLLYHLIRTFCIFLPPEKKKELLESIAEKVQEKYYVWAYLGTVYKELGEKEKALFSYEKALGLVEVKEDKVAIYTHLADLYLKNDEFKKAIEISLKGLAIEEMSELYNIMGRAYYKLGDYFMAMNAFFKAIELNPSSAIDYANIGFCLKSLNQIPTAQIFFLKALELDPDLKMAKIGLKYCEAFLNNQN